MADYREIIDLDQFARVIAGLAVALPVVAILVGLIVGSVRGNVAGGVLKGLAIGLLGPLIYGLWLLYSALIRYNPQTGYVGLHHVSVLVLNVALFALVGIILGFVYRRVFCASAAPSDEPSGGAV
jgi:chromate transport protein ChrA